MGTRGAKGHMGKRAGPPCYGGLRKEHERKMKKGKEERRKGEKGREGGRKEGREEGRERGRTAGKPPTNNNKKLAGASTRVLVPAMEGSPSHWRGMGGGF